MKIALGLVTALLLAVSVVGCDDTTTPTTPNIDMAAKGAADAGTDKDMHVTPADDMQATSAGDLSTTD